MLHPAAAQIKGRKLILPLYNVAPECVAPWLLQAPFQKWPQLRRRPELRHGVQFLERGGERVRQAPCRARLEFLVLRLEVILVDGGGQVPWDLQLAFDERLVDDEFRGVIREWCLTDQFDVAGERLEISLHPVHAD